MEIIVKILSTDERCRLHLRNTNLFAGVVYSIAMLIARQSALAFWRQTWHYIKTGLFMLKLKRCQAYHRVILTLIKLIKNRYWRVAWCRNIFNQIWSVGILFWSLWLPVFRQKCCKQNKKPKSRQTVKITMCKWNNSLLLPFNSFRSPLWIQISNNVVQLK